MVKALRIKAVLVGMAMLFVMTACAAGGTANGGPSSTVSPTATVESTPTTTSAPTPTASDEQSASSMGRLQDVPDTYEHKEQAVDVGEFAAPTSQPPNLTEQSEATLEWKRSVDAQASSYWASDWCHYFTGTDGRTYGDTCVRASVNSAGAILPNQYTIYRYDPTRNGKLGAAIFEMYTGFPGYTTFRDLTDPVFQTVSWVAFPAGVQTLTQDQYWVGIHNANGQLSWYTLRQILAMSNAGQANGMRVPAWDPSITVWTYPMLSGINASLRQIPSFIP